MSELKINECEACGYQWKEGESGYHKCLSQEQIDRVSNWAKIKVEQAEADLASMRRRAESAEACFAEQRDKCARLEAEHSRIYDEKNKDYAELQQEIDILKKQNQNLSRLNIDIEEALSAQDDLRRKAEAVALAKTKEMENWPFFSDEAVTAMKTQIAELTRQRDEEKKDAEAARLLLKMESQANAEAEKEIERMRILLSLPTCTCETGALGATQCPVHNPPGAGQIDIEKQRLRQERDNWERSAADFHRNAEFYRGIVRRIGDTFGIAARTSDDGSVQDDVLALKVPELVHELHRRAFAYAGPMEPDQPGAGKAPPTDYTEALLASLERDNDRLRAVLDGIQTLVTLSE